MAEDYKCPHCETDFKNPQGLTNHIKFKHPEELEKKLAEEKGVPDAADDFELLLKDYGVKKASIIVKHIAATGSPNVFDDPREMAKKLAQWPRDIAPMYRASILEHWSSTRGITLPEELLEEVAMEEKVKKEKAKKKEAEKKQGEGAVWTVDVDESGMPKIRMIKEETEPGVTLAEAKTAAKEIGKEREEPIVVYNEEAGKHMPNFKSPFVKQNLSAAWSTARQMDRAMAEGEPIDPMDVWIDQQAKLAQLKELMGITPEPKERGNIAEIVSALKDLQTLVTPAKGGDSEIAEALRTEIAEMRKSVEDMKEDRWREQFTNQQKQITEITNVLTKSLEAIADVRKGLTGRTEMDIIHEIATEGIGFLKTELPGVRRDIKEAIGSVSLPPGKTTEQKQERKQKYKQAIETDREIEEIGRRLFFSEG